MRIAITGARGFIGQNLQVVLKERGWTDVVCVAHDVDEQALLKLLAGVSLVFHLAGVNRPKDTETFLSGNAQFTQRLCRAMGLMAQPPRVVFTSSIQAALDNAYGLSKQGAEQALLDYASATGTQVRLLRLPNVFGKWSRPNYNSAVATFCHNIARGLPVTINNAEAEISLVYIDDLMACFLDLLADTAARSGYVEVVDVHTIKVGELAETLRRFHDSRDQLMIERVGTGLIRKLYSTYVSFLPIDQFAYAIPRHADARGVFVEMLKTPDCGQFSFFTAHPGVSRGEHYHHSKTEKFLVIQGSAHFGFRHILTNETHGLDVAGADSRVVETIPGWTHNITNVGTEDLIVMLWANEVFDRQRPDTIGMKVRP